MRGRPSTGDDRGSSGRLSGNRTGGDTGIDPLTMTPVYTATGLRAKKLQKALLLYWSPDQWPLAREALREAGRADLIGIGPDALVPPEHAVPTHAARAR